MKTPKCYLVAVSFCLTLFTVEAQKPVIVQSETFTLGENQYDGVVVDIPEVNIEQVKNEWVKIIEKGTKSSVVEAENGEVSIFGAYIKTISENPINIFCQFVSQDSAVRLRTSVELRRDFYITESASESEYNQLKEYVHDFAKNEYIIVVKEDLKRETKKLQDLEDELKSLQSDKARLDRSIQDNENSILTSNDALLILNSDLELKNQELLSHKEALNKAQNDLVKADLEEKIGAIEKEKNKILNTIEKENKNIARSRSDIEDAQNNIQTNIGQQGSKSAEVESQRSVVIHLESKLATIESY